MSKKEKTTKHEFLSYAYTDLTAMEQHFEEMTAQGWMIKSIRGGMTYTRCESRTLRFNAQIISSADPFGNEISPETGDLVSFCEEAGWRLVDHSGALYVFYNEDLEAPDIVTDDAEKLETIKHSIAKTNRFSWIGAIVSTLMLALAALMYFTGEDKSFHGLILLVFLCSWILSFYSAVINTLLSRRWIKNAEEAVLEGRPIPFNDKEKVKWKNDLGKLIGILTAIILFGMVIWALALGSDSIKPVLSGFIFAIPTVLFALHLAKKDLSRSKMALYITLFVLALSAVMTGFILLIK